MGYLVLAYDAQNIRLNADSAEVEVPYFANEFSNELEVAAYSFYNLPPFYGTGGAALESIDVGDRIGLGSWKMTARYSMHRSKPINQTAAGGGGGGGGGNDPDLEAMEIDYTASTEEQHIDVARATTGYPAGAPNENKSIGVTKDGIQGTSIPAGVESFTFRKFFRRSQVTNTLKNQWNSCRGKINGATWGDYARGEVLMESWSVSLRGASTNVVPVNFNFKARKNAVDVVFPDPVGTSPLTRGWQAVDRRFEEVTVDEVLTKRLKYVYVHDVIPEADFSVLGLT